MHPLKEMHATLLVAATLIPHFSFTYGVLINITVDDWLPNHNTNEQLTFTPAWNVGQSCVTCAARPDPAVAYRGSWRDTTYDKNVVADNQSSAAFFTFNGSALYVYGIQCHTQICSSDMSFFIDGQPYGNYLYTPTNNGLTGFVYNVLLFAVNSLPLRPHTFRLENGRPGGNLSLVLLDYLIYTTDFVPPSEAVQPSGIRISQIPHEWTPPSTPYPTPMHGARPITPSRNHVVLVTAICIGTLLATLLIWRGAVFYLRRNTTVRDDDDKLQSDTSILSSDTTPSPSQTSRITGHHPPSTGTTLFSNVGVVQAEIGQRSPVSPGGTMGLTRKTEKWHALIYGGNRNSRVF